MESDYDFLPSEVQREMSKKLDQLISNLYDFVDKPEPEGPIAPILESVVVDPTIVLYSYRIVEDQEKRMEKRQTWMPKSRLYPEKISEEDLKCTAVSAEWILNKKGVYGNGREKRGELITGAIHSPAMKSKKINKKC